MAPKKEIQFFQNILDIGYPNLHLTIWDVKYNDHSIHILGKLKKSDKKRIERMSWERTSPIRDIEKTISNYLNHNVYIYHNETLFYESSEIN